MRDPPRRHSDFRPCGAYALTFTDFSRPSHTGWPFLLPHWGGREASWPTKQWR
nr:MAG TPA: hypothetical protein [Caudoviricetes sp.]